MKKNNLLIQNEDKIRKNVHYVENVLNKEEKDVLFLTSDYWTPHTGDSFIITTCHCIDPSSQFKELLQKTQILCLNIKRLQRKITINSNLLEYKIMKQKDFLFFQQIIQQNNQLLERIQNSQKTSRNITNIQSYQSQIKCKISYMFPISQMDNQNQDLQYVSQKLIQQYGNKLKFGVDQLYEILIELINKDYIISNFLGAGGEGPVFEAINNNKKVAIKCILVNNVDRLNSEIERVTELTNQPYIHQFIEGFYCSKNKYYFYLTELLQCNLESIMQNFEKNKNSMPLNSIIAFAIQMAKALSVLQKYKVLHCDIKPSNILYDKKKQCFKLSDYGLSKVCSNIDKSQTNMINEGTFKYTAPEELSEEQEFSNKKYIYSLGLILVELKLGRFLSLNEAYQIKHDTSQQKQYLSDQNNRKLDQIIVKILEINRQNRISLEELQVELNSMRECQKLIFFKERNQILRQVVNNNLQEMVKIYKYSFNRIDDSCFQNTQMQQKLEYLEFDARYTQSFFISSSAFKFPMIKNEVKFKYFEKILQNLFQCYKLLNDQGIIIKYFNEQYLYFTLFGLKDSFYEGYVIHGFINFIQEFPCKPPSIVIQSNIFHPYIFQKNDQLLLNVDVFDKEWSPALMSIRPILLMVQDPLNEEPSKQIENCGFKLEETIEKVKKQKQTLQTIDQFINSLQNHNNYANYIKDKCN